MTPIHPRHQPLPVRLNDLSGAVIRELLHKHQHPRSQGPGSSFPHLESRVLRPVRPAQDFVVVFPAVDQQAFEMAHRKEVAEEDLVAENGFTAYD